jgi:hypothetical protein
LLLFFVVNATTINGEVWITDDQRWNLLQIKAQEARALRAVTVLRENGIEPILIKGVAASVYYPASRLRGCTDVDLAVAKTDFLQALQIARSPAADGFAIDLHCELRHLDTLPWDDLFHNSREITISNGSVRVLRPEDHLRVLIVHWLTDGGADRERLWDIYYAVDNRPADFDWERLLDQVSSHRRRWLVCTIGLAHRFLGLRIDDTPVNHDALDLPLWLVKAVEQEWSAEIKNQPLETTLHDPVMMLRQVGKRLRPNPIWATVQMEGSFDARTRFFYRSANLFKRIPDSCRRIVNTIRLNRNEPKA